MRHVYCQIASITLEFRQFPLAGLPRQSEDPSRLEVKEPLWKDANASTRLQQFLSRREIYLEIFAGAE
jgi:hypothetical protein